MRLRVCVCVCAFPEAIDETVGDRMRRVNHASLSRFLSVTLLSPPSFCPSRILRVSLITACRPLPAHFFITPPTRSHIICTYM